MGMLPKYKLVIIGGAEDKKGRKVILKTICDLINKPKDKLLITTVASEIPNEVASDYLKVFKDMGINNIDVLNLNSRKESYEEKNINLVRKAKLIFFTGGDQLRITSIIGGTPIVDELKNCSEFEKIIVGTSAGASVMSNTMILNGEDQESPKKHSVNMSPGLGLLNDIIIDQHFAQRGRVGRLLTAIAENPSMLGIGIDENTAIIVEENGYIKVIGESAVYIFDGNGISYSNVSEQSTDKTFSIFNIKLHVLVNGDSFDLIKKIPFEEEALKNEDNKQKNI